MHENHRRRHKRDPMPEPVQTVVSLVYVTATANFPGPIAGYSTLSDSDTSDSVTSYWVVATISGDVVSWQNTETIADANAVATSPASVTSAASSASVTNSALSVDTSSVVVDPSTTLDMSQTSLLVASNTFATSTAASQIAAASSSSSSTASADSSKNSSSSSGLSGGGIAGIIIGLVCFAGVAAFFIFYCSRKKNKKRGESQREIESEKPASEYNGMLAAPRRAPSSANAPQLNAIRPITQFSPNFSGSGESFAMAPAPPRPNSPAHSGWERNMSEKQEMNPENPFGTHAAADSNEHNAANPFGNHASTANGAKVLEGAAVAGAAGAAIGARLSQDVPKPLDLSKTANASRSPAASLNESSPSSDMSGMSGSTTSNSVNSARVAAGQFPVHRVLIDFQPSIRDEVRLSANDLVRILNSYDDGWCFVAVLNRREQGVCPRSCLSSRPLPPRLPRSQQQGRPMTPNQASAQGRPAPQSPTASQSSSSRSVNPQSLMRPVAPGQARPMTPGSGGQPPAAMSGIPLPLSLAGTSSGSSFHGHPQARPMTPSSGGQVPAAMSGVPQPMSPLGSPFRGPPQGRPMSPGPKVQGEDRSRSPSISQNQDSSKTLPSPSSMIPAAPEPAPPSSPTIPVLSTTSSTRAEQSSSMADLSTNDMSTDMSSTVSTSAVYGDSPEKPIHPSQIPLPTTPVGRKPVPGQAL